jgi:hypothetical protein
MDNETFRGVNMNCESPGNRHSLQTIKTASFFVTRLQLFIRGSCEDSAMLCDLCLNGEQLGDVTFYMPHTDYIGSGGTYVNNARAEENDFLIIN